MLKHRGPQTFLTYSFLVIMMMINEAAFPGLEVLATGMISEQLAPLISQCLISRNNDVKHKNKKPRKPSKKERKRIWIQVRLMLLWRQFLKIKFEWRWFWNWNDPQGWCCHPRSYFLNGSGVDSQVLISSGASLTGFPAIAHGLQAMYSHYESLPSSCLQYHWS